DEKNKLAKLSLSQNQKISEDVLLFEFPVTVRFQSKGGSLVDRQITVKEKSEDFYFPLPEAPEVVRLNPELTLLVRCNFTPATPMVQAQLKNTTDMIGRLIAVEQLGAKKDNDSIKRHKE